MKDYSDLGLNPKLRKENSIATYPRDFKDATSFDVEIERGSVKQTHTNKLYALSAIGVLSPTELVPGEEISVIATIQNRQDYQLLGIQESTFYEGTAVDGDYSIPSGGSIPVAAYDLSVHLDWGATNNKNLKALNFLRNTTAGTVTVIFRNQWRFIIPPGTTA